MRKLIFGLMMVLSGSVSGNCDECNAPLLSPYFGVEVQNKQIKSLEAGDMSSLSTQGAALLAGLKIHENFGIEGGLHCTYGKKQGVKISHEGVYGSAMVYLPLGDFSLVGGLGLAYSKVGIGYSDAKFAASDAIPRVSAGAVYSVNDNLGIRYMAVWEKSSKIGAPDWGLKNSLHNHVGLVYSF